MKNKKGWQINQTEIAKEIIETTLARTKPVDGIPNSLILPSGVSSNIQELYAAGLKQLEGVSIDHIILISEKKPQQENRKSFIKKNGHLDTPVGKIEIDTNLAEALLHVFPDNLQPQKEEHFSELVPLFPYLKRACPFAKLLPILVDPRDIDFARKLSSTLANMLEEKQAALIALSNLEDITFTAIEFCSTDVFIQSIPLIKDHTHSKEIVSYAPIVAALEYAQKTHSNTATVLKSVSGLETETQVSQHQASIMLWQYRPPDLVPAQQEELLQLAKDTIRSYIKTKEVPQYKTEDPAFNRKSGVFVTLRQSAALRGCIGRMQSDMPLYKAVQEMAIAAATSDPRFPPITFTEINELSFKIAILSPLRRITTNEVEVGKHGLLIAHQGRRGVLLPEVPVERGWNREMFLANLCLKAGLRPGVWRENPTLYAFTAVEFGN